MLPLSSLTCSQRSPSLYSIACRTDIYIDECQNKIRPDVSELNEAKSD